MSHFEHYELNTSNPAVAKKFYSALFGWTFQDVPVAGGSTYTLISSNDKPFGGLQRKPVESVPDHWLAYATVDNIETAVALAQKAGGILEAGVIEIPGIGKYAVFRDPTGSPFAMWEQLGSHGDAGKKKAGKKKAGKKKAGKKNAGKEKAGKKKAGKKKAGEKKAGKKKAGKKKAGKKKAGKQKAGKKR